MNALNTMPLLLIDELGYAALRKASATWFLQLCQRYEHRATVITTDSPFVGWRELLGDVAV